MTQNRTIQTLGLRSRRSFALLACAAVLITSGCFAADPSRMPSETGGADGSSGDGGGGGGADDALASAVECLQGTWNEDMANLLAQWQSSSPGGAGLPVTGVEGSIVLTVTERSMVYALDQIARTAMPGSAGFTGEAVTSGSATFDYRVSSPTQITVGPVTAQSVTSVTRVYIGGELSNETRIAWDGGIQGEGIWWCEGDTLSLEPAASGWIHLYTRAR